MVSSTPLPAMTLLLTKVVARCLFAPASQLFLLRFTNASSSKETGQRNCELRGSGSYAS